MEYSSNLIMNIKPYKYRYRHKFRKAQTVWCEREKQWGKLTSDARLRASDMRPGLNPPSDPKAIPGYDVRFGNGDFGTYLETDLQSINAYRLARVNAWATEHKPALKAAGIVVSAVGAIAAISGLVLKVFG